MAFIRPFFQILSSSLTNPTLLKCGLQGTPSTFTSEKRFIQSWFGKKKPIELECKTDNVVGTCCKRRVPQCPEHICSGCPSKCDDPGYGKMIKVKQRTWFTFKTIKVKKQKPSNCPPPPCPKYPTVSEYIFGPPPNLPDPYTCRRYWKNIEEYYLPEDPRYQKTEGDLVIFSEDPKIKPCMTPKPFGPKPKPPPEYRLPTPVICKKVADTVSTLDCYCAYVEPKPYDCVTNLCPVHAVSYKLPYAEMRPPRPPQRRAFSCAGGIQSADIGPRQRPESCTCTAIFEGKKNKFPPSPQTCEKHGKKQLAAPGNYRRLENTPHRKLSRSERLKLEATQHGGPIGHLKDLEVIEKREACCSCINQGKKPR